MNQYLTIQQQDVIRSKYNKSLQDAHLKDKFFANYGDYVSAGISLAANIVIFRCGFRAFKMYKYNRGRLINLVMSTTFTVQASILHKIIASDHVLVYYRDENMWNYGFRSLIAHNIAFPAQVVFAVGITFLNAQLNGMIPVRYGFLDKGRRMETLRFVLKSMKPFSRTLATTYLITSAIMFYIGCREYSDSLTILKHINRQSLCQKED